MNLKGTKKICILSAYPESSGNFIATQAREWVWANPASGWLAVADPGQAEIILFLEHHPGSDPLFFRVLLHRCWRQWPEKCWLYHDLDYVIPFARGIYPSLERPLWKGGLLESWCYVCQYCENHEVTFSPVTGREAHLYSFVGAARTHSVRNSILALKDERAWLQDTSAFNTWSLPVGDREGAHRHYARIIGDSQFVLCPRGIGPTSYRLLETMKAGRAPVIISDDWPLPPGPEWQKFALIVPESEVGHIPQLLRRHEGEAASRGLLARLAWEHWYSNETKYPRLLEHFHHLASQMGTKKLSLLRAGFLVLRHRTHLRLLRASLRTWFATRLSAGVIQ